MPRSLVDIMMATRPLLIRTISYYVEPAGGAINDVDVAGSAFPHRTAQFSLNYAPWWSNASETESIVAAARVLGDHMRAHEAYVGHYVNYVDERLVNWPRHYYGANLERLLEVKRRWDPHAYWRGRFGLDKVTAEHLRFKLDVPNK
jgi:hypothetical protein